MTPDNALHFDSPEDGLLPGEHVVWDCPAGISFMTMFCGVCLPLLMVIPGLLIFALFDVYVGFTLLLLLIVGLSFTVRSCIIERRTMYYITSERVIHVLGGQIVQAILLDHLEGRPRSEILEIEVTHHENNRPVHKVRIIDPRASTSITLKNIDEDTAKVFGRIGETVQCPNCGHKNLAIRQQCTKCETGLK